MKKEKKKLTYDEIKNLVLDKFEDEKWKRFMRGDINSLGSYYDGEEPEATKLAKRLCKENNIPYNPDLIDFTYLKEMGL